MAIKERGRNRVLKNLNREILRIHNRTEQSIMKALLFIEHKAVKLTPVDTGNLRGSFYTKMINFKGHPAGEIGNLANYALFVHEGLDKNFKVGQAMFLEDAIKQNVNSITSIISNGIKV